MGFYLNWINFAVKCVSDIIQSNLERSSPKGNQTKKALCKWVKSVLRVSRVKYLKQNPPRTGRVCPDLAITDASWKKPSQQNPVIYGTGGMLQEFCIKLYQYNSTLDALAWRKRDLTVWVWKRYHQETFHPIKRKWQFCELILGFSNHFAELMAASWCLCLYSELSCLLKQLTSGLWRCTAQVVCYV